MKRLLKLALILSLIAGVAACAQAKSVTLGYNLKPGTVSRYKASYDMTIKIPGMPGGPGPMKMSMSSVYKQKVLAVLPDGSFKTQMTYESVKTQLPGAMGQGESTKQLVGKSVTMVMGKDGKVLSMEGINEVAGMNVNQFFGGIGQNGPALPSRRVEVGESWKDSVPIPAAGANMNMVTTLLAAAVPVGDENAAKLKQEFKGHLDLATLMKAMSAGSGMPMAAQGMSGGADLSGWIVSYLASESGQMLKSSGKMKIDAVMKFPAGSMPQGAPSQINFVMDMALNLTKIQ